MVVCSLYCAFCLTTLDIRYLVASSQLNCFGDFKYSILCALCLSVFFYLALKMATEEAFVREPSIELFLKFSKEQLLNLAATYEVEITSAEKRSKDTIKAVLQAALVSKGVLPVEKQSPVSMEALQLQIRLRELSIKEKEIEYERERLQTHAREQELENRLAMRKLEIEAQKEGVAPSDPNSFDVSRHIRLVPPFVERDVERYFPHFERVATNLNWPRTAWAFLLQCVLVGKAQEVYSSLTVEQSGDYDVVKAAVLRCYQLIPEAYRQKFRNLKKAERHTFVEFGRDKAALFDRWCSSQRIDSQEKLRDLILVEEFKNCLPTAVATYVSEQKAESISEAAILADEYVLTHNIARERYRLRVNPSTTTDVDTRRNVTIKSDDRHCFYCKKPGHVVAECLILKKKQSTKPMGLVSSSSKIMSPVRRAELKSGAVEKTQSMYGPFLTKGTVSVPGEEAVAVRILRDTGAAQSFLLRGLLPLSEKTAIGSSVLVRGIEMGFLDVPLHRVHLESELVCGDVVVGVQDSLPIPGVTFLLGNDLAGGNVWSRGDIPPEVVSVPLVQEGLDECAQKFPEVFHASVVTRSQTQRLRDVVPPNDVDLSDSFVAHPEECERLCEPAFTQSRSSPAPVVKDEKRERKQSDVSLSLNKLINAQQKDPTLVSCFKAIQSVSDHASESPAYFIRDGLLMRRWRPQKSNEWNDIEQIVMPSENRRAILSVAHDCVAGHLGVTKTFNRVLRHFFWPGLKRDVRRYCKTCHVCQVSGKPNQTIPPAPLYPIPAIGEPFEKVIIDCVGPLPRSKSGYQYLLTIMCTATRFPEAVPLRKITARIVSRALLKFFSFVGLPKIVQSDQGTNFTSRIFSQVLKSLQIKHRISSAYHPESQGALERYHQTLKSMLRAYCLEVGTDWEDAIPWMLMASREVVQESIGFSPAELVFAHDVRTPLSVIKDQWLSKPTSRSALQFISDAHTRLHRARELARENLEKTQSGMKTWYDQKAKARSFKPGDQVLVLLPVPGSVFQARFRGPYTVEKKISDLDYVILTPDKRRHSRVCHVNMLKPYYTRDNIKTDLCNFNLPGPESSVLLSSLVEDDDAVTPPSRCVIEGRLNNSAMLSVIADRLPHLTPSQTADILSVIADFPELFGDVPTVTTVLEHDIDVGDGGPIKQHPYRVNPEKRAILQREVEYMVKNNIAEPSSSPWSSPCLLVGKPDGTYRFCTDYRRVNTITLPDCYPLPRMDDCVDRVGSAMFVTKIDLLKGYWQVPLTPRAKQISAFVTPDAFMHYKVMAFGNA